MGNIFTLWGLGTKKPGESLETSSSKKDGGPERSIDCNKTGKVRTVIRQ